VIGASTGEDNYSNDEKATVYMVIENKLITERVAVAFDNTVSQIKVRQKLLEHKP